MVSHSIAEAAWLLMLGLELILRHEEQMGPYLFASQTLLTHTRRFGVIGALQHLQTQCMGDKQWHEAAGQAVNALATLLLQQPSVMRNWTSHHFGNM